MAQSIGWRACLFVAGAAILVGGPQHPRGSMAEMLADPRWVPSHLIILAGFLALLAGLVLQRRAVILPPRAARWTGWIIWATAIQAAEMVLHTAAVVDHGHLVAGHSTPILGAHLAMSLVAYPLFGLVATGWIVATARDRTLASPWVAWLGIAGALAHGAAPPLVVGLGIMEARILFPMVMLFALWCVAVAAWPVRAAAREGAESSPAPAGAATAG